MDNFNEIKSRQDLADILNMPLKKLTYILYKKGTENYYVSFEIPKKNGGSRHINAPQGDLKDIQKKLVKVLWQYQKKFVKEDQI